MGSKLFEVKAGAEGEFSAELLWESVRLKAKFTNVVLYKGFIYGLDDGIMVCLDPETGER